MGLCDQQKLSVRSDQAAGLLCEQCGGMMATTWQPCANNVLKGWQGWWRQCVAMVVTVWHCAPCYHIQLTTTVAKNNFDASAAFK
ncbi:Uncharacterised protein [Escherichia coli]|nr:hypothetical protein G902_00439 [Escherichia coli UMEA 3052-1]STJ68134.1 Uncharacterised protein [Escherichia coli]VEC45817.1 Uncharacterised protein [Escherichia coli]